MEPTSRSSAGTVSFVQVRPWSRARSGPPYTAVRNVAPSPRLASTSSLENKLEADLFGQTRRRVSVVGTRSADESERAPARHCREEQASRTSISSDGRNWAAIPSVVVDMFNGCVAPLSN